VKPTSAGRRFQTYATFEEITTDRPEKSLVEPLRKSGGRNNVGRVTAWQRGGGHKRRYRIIDFKRDKENIPAKVATVEYDPNRSAHIALLHFSDGEKRYILAPVGLKVGDQVTVDGSRAKDGSNSANARKVVLPDGRRVFGGSSAPDAPQ